MFRQKLMLGALSLTMMMMSCSDQLDDEYPENVQESSISNPELLYPDEQGETIYLNRKSSNPLKVRYVDNQYIMGGDIVLSQKQVQQLQNSSNVKRAGSADLSTRWPNGEVFYTISGDLIGDPRITEAMEQWESQVPNIKFIPRTDEPNYVMFVVGRGCGSMLGMTGGRQFIYVSEACTTGNMIHEIGHTLGLLHEIQRSDREDAIIINLENVDEDHLSHFDTFTQARMNTFEFGPFDINSMMMTGSYDYSINGLPTVEKIGGGVFTVNRTALSEGDIETVSYMYERPEIIGASFACNTSNSTYAFETFVPTTPIWSVSDNLEIVSSTDTSITVRAVNPTISENATISADLNGLITTKDIWIGIPQTPNSLTHESVFTCYGGEITVEVEGAESYEWQISRGEITSPNTNGGLVYNGEAATIYVDPVNDAGGFTVQVKAINACGETSFYTKFIPTDCNAPGGSVAL